MNSTRTTLRAGFRRGMIELRQAFTGALLVGNLFWPVATLAAVFLFRNMSFGANGFNLGEYLRP